MRRACSVSRGKCAISNAKCALSTVEGYAVRQMKHFKVILKPDGKQISIHEGATIADAAGQAGIILNGVCGGQGTCKKCQVYIEPDNRKVLACQYRIDWLGPVSAPRTCAIHHKSITLTIARVMWLALPVYNVTIAPSRPSHKAS